LILTHDLRGAPYEHEQDLKSPRRQTDGDTVIEQNPTTDIKNERLELV
jgi:hypothetical protein